MMDKRGKLLKYRQYQHKVQQLKKENDSEVIDMMLENDVKEEE